ncbi:hypothetical protein F4804DRAFT_207698 [Jackrogersella minutella]|nr:hypothetical protein F4804DRAFT_207698 [Jackrogersella minutella]
MASWGLPPREQAYMPYKPSPLNPSNFETLPKQQRRSDQCRSVKHEQSPTQRLMRQKAAAAWRTMSSRDATISSHAQTIAKEVDEKASAQMEDSCPVRTAAVHYSEDKCHDADVAAQQIDMEKQTLADGNYHRVNWTPKTNYPLHLLTAKRLIIAIGILCVIGVLSAMRAIAVSKIQAWRT